MRRAVAALLCLLASVSAAHAVDLQARLSRTSLSVGETTALEIEISDSPILGNQKPEITLPPDIEVLGTMQSTNLTFVNGRASNTVVFRYELAPRRPGNFTVGPFRVRAGRELLEHPPLALRVGTTQARVPGGGASGGNAASLIVDVTPRDPYVGQPVLLRVRLIERQEFAEERDYSPPSAPGFWAERFSPNGTYQADEGGRSVRVTEQTARLYPLASGLLRVGPATATIYLYDRSQGLDPLALLGGGRLRPVPIRSAEIPVRVRPLPPGAPPGFDGATGDFVVTFSADRLRTTQDVPVTVWLEVRGIGNVPFIRTPTFTSESFEVFGSTVEDSFPPAGTLGAARRRFQWTLLPRKVGRLDLEPPLFSWFDPVRETYRTADLPALVVQVGPPAGPTGANAETFPAEFTRHPLDPTARPAEPWAFAIAGVALGFAWRLARRPSFGEAEAVDQARRREWLQAVGLGAGPDFWTAAEQASAWLEARGRPVATLREQIAAARYGGAARSPDVIRTALVRHLSQGISPRTPVWVWRASAAALAAAGIAIVFLSPRTPASPARSAGPATPTPSHAVARSSRRARSGCSCGRTDREAPGSRRGSRGSRGAPAAWRPPRCGCCAAIAWSRAIPRCAGWWHRCATRAASRDSFPRGFRCAGSSGRS